MVILLGNVYIRSESGDGGSYVFISSCQHVHTEIAKWLYSLSLAAHQIGSNSYGEYQISSKLTSSIAGINKPCHFFCDANIYIWYSNAFRYSFENGGYGVIHFFDC